MIPQNHKSIRAMLLWIIGLGLAATELELLFIGHDESATQFVPLVLIGLGLAFMLWHALARSLWSLRALRVTMLAFIVAGMLGIALHYRGSVEFQKELDPSMRGFTLFMKVMQSKAPPALAPAVLIQLGLIGLVCTYPLAEPKENL